MFQHLCPLDYIGSLLHVFHVYIFYFALESLGPHLHAITGYYAYIETSSPRRRGDYARLISGPFSDVQCLHFSYSMVGSTIGKLNIYHLIHGIELDIWARSGKQRGSDWHSDNATLYGNNYYVSLVK